MRKVSILMVIATMVLTLNSCRDGNRGIDMIYTDFFEIQSGANTIETHYFQSELRSANWSTFLGELEPEQISKIQPSFARLTNTQGIPFDFIDQVVIEIYPDENLTVTPWEFAFRNNIPFNEGTTLEIIPGLADFKDELSDDQFIYRIGLRYRDFPPITFPVVLDFGFTAVPL